MITIRHLKISHLISLVMMLFLISIAADASAYQTKSNKENRVRVDVRPVQLLHGKPAKFEIRMNTHSVDLSQDLVAVCTLTDTA